MNSNQETGYDFTQQIGFLLRRAYQRHAAIFQQTVPESQLSAAQFVVLLTIRDQGPCEIAFFVEKTAIDEPSIRGIVERLKWRELVQTKHEPGDGRNMVVTLTSRGQKLLDQVVPHARQITEQTYGNLSETERTTLVALLHKMMGNPV